MRIVVDTNVFISACIGRGPASKVIEACIAGDAQPVMSTALYLEFEDVLARDMIFHRGRLNPQERDALFDIFLGKCLFPKIHFIWRPNLHDQDDNHVVDLAVAGNVDAIVTENVRDFHGGELRFPRFRIITSKQFTEDFGR
ncbi:MAG: putative toxin-antitoxin system toxin component, PIN family [Allorhizobium sp.]